MQSLTRTFGLLALVLLSLSSVGLSACGEGEDDGGISEGRSGQILVQPDRVSFSRTLVGETATREVVISNVHRTESLQLHEISLHATEGRTAADLELFDVPSDGTVLGPEESVTMGVAFTAQGEANAGYIEFRSSDPARQEDPVRVDVESLASRPQIQVDPSVVRFPRLPIGGREERGVTVRNLGTAPLVIYSASYSGSNDFSVDDTPDDQIVLDPYDSAQAETNPERFQLDLNVRYSPRDDGGGSGQIRIESNDTSGETTDDGRGVMVVDVQANAEGPCILVDRTTRQFGQVPIGATVIDAINVSNCGTDTLSISGIEISENSDDDEFGVDLQSRDVNDDGQLDENVELEPGDIETFSLEYSPVQVGSDTGTAVIRSNDPAQPALELQLIGRGSDGECPEASIAAKVRGVSTSPRPTVSAAPLDYVVLDGTGSSDPDGRVVEYIWSTIEIPEEINDPLGPTSEDSDDSDPSKREFRAVVAGTYKYGLQVRDNEGFLSCNEAVATIVATPNEKLHIELTWTNPEDPDESDRSGSDVDVHLVKMGPGEWFDQTYDIFFNNPNNGASGAGIWNPESPSLDLDDTDGAGPENIQMDDPSDCEWYAVGVHYYQQLHGTAYATLRIYINENLVYEQLNTPLQSGGQFWDVARIHWNQGQAIIQDVNTIMPIAPREEAPTVTDDMANSDLCTTQGLY